MAKRPLERFPLLEVVPLERLAALRRLAAGNKGSLEVLLGAASLDSRGIPITLVS
ncbi:hypothetical protein OAE59_01245 [Synechococcus sp. AH-551-B05]|nr:hypothetical protein [Synechococcus sp. AH-551-B05]MDB4677246.1 hypothetical protein [Synechococcus sp. AH-551-B05]